MHLGCQPFCQTKTSLKNALIIRYIRYCSVCCHGIHSRPSPPLLDDSCYILVKRTGRRQQTRRQTVTIFRPSCPPSFDLQNISKTKITHALLNTTHSARSDVSRLRCPPPPPHLPVLDRSPPRTHTSTLFSFTRFAYLLFAIIHDNTHLNAASTGAVNSSLGLALGSANSAATPGTPGNPTPLSAKRTTALRLPTSLAAAARLETSSG